MAEINITEIVREITMEVDNEIETFMVREVQEYADKQGENVIINAKMIYEAVTKQIPKKPYWEGDGYDEDGEIVYDIWRCPNCDEKYEYDYDIYDHCPNCGQAIDWSKKGE